MTMIESLALKMSAPAVAATTVAAGETTAAIGLLSAKVAMLTSVVTGGFVAGAIGAGISWYKNREKPETDEQRLARKKAENDRNSKIADTVFEKVKPVLDEVELSLLRSITAFDDESRAKVKEVLKVIHELQKQQIITDQDIADIKISVDKLSGNTDHTTDGDKEPTDGDKEPADGDKEPTDGDKEPTDGAKKPADSTKKPADGAKKPADSTKKPADSTKKPADGAKKLADGAKKPAVG